MRHGSSASSAALLRVWAMRACNKNLLPDTRVDARPPQLSPVVFLKRWRRCVARIAKSVILGSERRLWGAHPQRAISAGRGHWVGRTAHSYPLEVEPWWNPQPSEPSGRRRAARTRHLPRRGSHGGRAGQGYATQSRGPPAIDIARMGWWCSKGLWRWRGGAAVCVGGSLSVAVAAQQCAELGGGG